MGAHTYSTLVIYYYLSLLLEAQLVRPQEVCAQGNCLLPSLPHYASVIFNSDLVFEWPISSEVCYNLLLPMGPFLEMQMPPQGL